MEIPLSDAYRLVSTEEREAFRSFVRANLPIVFALHQRVSISDLLTEEEKAAAQLLRTQFGRPGEIPVYNMHGMSPSTTPSSSPSSRPAS